MNDYTDAAEQIADCRRDRLTDIGIIYASWSY
jgi:hypothetical protein